ncbi:hypothetical protein DPMN_070080 [Dreissena polymorpha]|uniref:Uncharacterized protein n=1 Tax=Dreissena polymorpha TaxID=45954 RepID=A0A9D3Z0P1_DREPO|nr:hypothetical protein DPMN_070080 [Dreissena polymorpha]
MTTQPVRYGDHDNPWRKPHLSGMVTMTIQPVRNGDHDNPWRKTHLSGMVTVTTPGGNPTCLVW